MLLLDDDDDDDDDDECHYIQPYSIIPYSFNCLETPKLYSLENIFYASFQVISVAGMLGIFLFIIVNLLLLCFIIFHFNV